MSLMGLNRFIKRYGMVVAAVLGFVFVVGGVVSGLGGAIGGGQNPAANAAAATDEAPVATVGGRKVSRAEVEQIAQQSIQQQAGMMAMMGQKPDAADMDRYRFQALDTIKQQEALVAAAKTAGVTVTDADIAAARDEQWKRLREQFVQTLGLQPGASEVEFNNAVAKQNPNLTESILKEQALPADRVRVAATYGKLAEKFKADAKPTDEAVKRSLSDVTVRHILVKFGQGALPEAQARTKAEKLLAEVKASPAKFAELAKKETDDEGSKAKGGEYTWTPSQRQGIVPEFRAALDKLQPGQTYPEIVKHEGGGYNGFHIIRLESVKQGADFPKDFDKEKAKYAEQYAEQFVQQRMQAAIDAALPGIPAEVTDPGLKAEELQMAAMSAADAKERGAKLDEALAQLAKIDAKDDPLGTVPVRKARIYQQQNKPAEAIAAYEEALKSRNSPETRLALAQLYLAQKDKEKAKAQLGEAEKLAISSPMSYLQISQMYKEAGDAAKGKAASDKANALFQRMQEAQQQAQQAPPITPAPAGSPAAPAAKK